MSQMEELYQKVAGDSALQTKFAERRKDTETVGGDAAGIMLIEFAREAGFKITIEEMKEFFAQKSSEAGGELSDAELDAVAGGKMSTGGFAIGALTSIFTAGVICATISITQAQMNSSCENYFDTVANR